MSEWLIKRKRFGSGDEKELRDIFSLPDYKVEFDRYSDPALPVCGLSFEEAVDFFMNFDKKDFENPRLQYKKDSFIAFYNDIEQRMKNIGGFTALDAEDYKLMETLLKNGLPDCLLDDVQALDIILIISIGNSMGWPYGHYIDYDAANLDLFESKGDFLHVTAHEIHHLFAGQILFADGISPQEFFLQNFAYEGLAVHYCNNLATVNKRAKYKDRTYAMDRDDMAFFEARFDEIFNMIREDYKACGTKTYDEVKDVVSKYEQFTFMGKKIKQYPTYYFGCYLWGLLDLYYGKEVLFDALSSPGKFAELYNGIADEKYRLNGFSYRADHMGKTGFAEDRSASGFVRNET